MNAARLPIALASSLGLALAFTAACAPAPVRPVDAGPGDADGGDAAPPAPVIDAATIPDVGGPLPSLDAGSPILDAGVVIDVGSPVDAGPLADGAAPSTTTCATGTLAFRTNALGGVSVRTSHYDLVTGLDGASAEEYARLLEASYASFRRTFGDDPIRNGTGPLHVQLHASTASLAAALASADAGAPPASGAVYVPATKTVYASVQNARFPTRVLLLREVARQFQWLQSRFANEAMPSWYADGLLDWLARHDWDGNCVRLGVLPTLTADDYPRAAILETTVASFSLASIIVSPSGADAGRADAGATSATRPMGWGIVQFLQATDRQEWRSGFADYRRLVEASPSASFAATVGDPATMQSPLVASLQAQQEPFMIVAEEWEHASPSAFFGRASSSKLGAAILKRTGPAQLEANVRPDAPASFSAGVTTSYRGADSFTAVVVSGNGVVAEARVEGTNVTFTSLGDARALGSDGTARITASYSSNLVTVVINGRSFPRTLTAPPRLGFVVWGSRVRFGDVAFR